MERFVSLVFVLAIPLALFADDTIDNLHETGAQKGKTQYGVYKIEGDKWTVCMTRPGVAEGDRPKDFSTKDTPNVVFVFERLKEDNKP